MKSKKYIDENDVFIAALDEFIINSFDEASLNTIIKNANISKGSFYYRFKNKYALYIHILKTCLKQKWEYIREKIAENPETSTSKSIFEIFLVQAKISIDFAYKYPKYYMINKMFSKEKGTKLYEDALKDLGRHDEAGLKQLIVTATNNNDFNKRFPETFLVKLITYLFSSFDEIFFEKENFHLDVAYKNLENYIEFIRNGLAKQSS